MKSKLRHFIGTSSHCAFSNTIQNLPCSDQELAADGYQDRYEDSMQLDRVTQNLFRLSVFSELMAHSGIPTHASEGSLGPRGRCVSPRAGPLIPAQPISHRGQSMSALSLAFPQ